MKVLVVSGIWPPDVGGPASHAPELADWLVDHGHRVEVVTTAQAEPARRRYPVHWVSRRMPAIARYAWGSVLLARASAGADVVYSTGLFGRTRVGTFFTGKPRVLKLTGDPAYERAHRYGWTPLALDEFQRSTDLRVGGLKAMRDLLLSGARAYICPSASLAAFAADWRWVGGGRIEVLPNPVEVPEPGDRGQLRDRHGFEGPTLVFAGRLAPVKSLDVALEALPDDVSLVIAGDGPEREKLEQLAGPNVRFVGPQPRETVLELFTAADAVLLSSSWENFPHAVVESLAVGTPVIATSVGGVAEVVTDGENGLLVRRADAGALGAAIRRFFAEPELRERLRAGAAGSVGDYAPDRIYGRIEELLKAAAGSTEAGR